VNVLRCPSDGQQTGPRDPYAPTNYMGNFGGPGVYAALSGTIVPLPNTVGFIPNTLPATYGPVTIASITDGTSNTALMSEKLIARTTGNTPRNSPEALRTVFQAPQGQSYGSGQAGALAFVNSCRSIPGSTFAIGSFGSGQVWSAGFPCYIITNGYNHFGGPNDVACHNPSDLDLATCPSSTYVMPMGSAPPSSFHPGGVNLAFSDGSVKFVKNTVSLPTWWGLGTRAGGEVLSADGY